MRLSSHFQSRVVLYLDQLTDLGLKIGIPVLAIAIGYLLVTAFGGGLRDYAKLKAVDQKYLVQAVEITTRALIYACSMVVTAVIIRLWREEAPGQVLTLVGGILYFGSNAAFSPLLHILTPATKPMVLTIQQGFTTVGAVCVVPGLVLIVRDAILRIWNGMSKQRVREMRWGDEAELSRKHTKPKFYGKCWDMEYCREFVRKVCPAWKQRKPCWRVKVGCYCDEKTILSALANQGDANNKSFQGIMDSLGLHKTQGIKISAKVKRARCRRCGIYAEHQRQKYQLLSPMVFPVVALIFITYYDLISKYVWHSLAATDRFVAFLAYRTLSNYSFDQGGQIVTTFTIVWLMIMTLSYFLRILEYCIFELQV